MLHEDKSDDRIHILSRAPERLGGTSHLRLGLVAVHLPKVDARVALGGEARLATRALHRLLVDGAHVALQVGVESELGAADGARERPLVRVREEVLVEVVLAREASRTVRALEREDLLVLFLRARNGGNKQHTRAHSEDDEEEVATTQ